MRKQRSIYLLCRIIMSANRAATSRREKFERSMVIMLFIASISSSCTFFVIFILIFIGRGAIVAASIYPSENQYLKSVRREIFGVMLAPAGRERHRCEAARAARNNSYCTQRVPPAPYIKAAGGAAERNAEYHQQCLMKPRSQVTPRNARVHSETAK